MTDIIVRDETSQPDVMLNMIDRVCTSPDFDISKMEKLIEMRNQELTRQARIAYSASFADMQCHMPEIKETTQGHNYKYAAFEDIIRQLRPILQEHGFAVTFAISQEDKTVSVTATLLHRDGHSEKTSISLPHETSGSKNAVQAVGSTVSYGKRYTLTSLLNIATCGEDNDASSGSQFITYEQAGLINKILDDTESNKQQFLEYLKAPSVPQILARDYNKTMAVLNKKKKEANAND